MANRGDERDVPAQQGDEEIRGIAEEGDEEFEDAEETDEAEEEEEGDEGSF